MYKFWKLQLLVIVKLSFYCRFIDNIKNFSVVVELKVKVKGKGKVIEDEDNFFFVGFIVCDNCFVIFDIFVGCGGFFEGLC